MIEMLNCDCMEYMATLPDKAFDFACVDPPYGINITSEHMGGRKVGGRKARKHDKTKSWDNSTPKKEYFDELFRVSINQIIWGGNYFDIPKSRYFAIWDKGETVYGRDFAEAEYAWVRSGGTRICKESPNQKDRIHACQKPVALYKWLLSRYAKPGDRILDTHGGSGSICIACHDLGFDLTWMEIDEDYYNAACKRYQNHAAQAFLIEPEPEKLKQVVMI
jgi:site-specific DNA-methyltransferase (adenine-specific)